MRTMKNEDAREILVREGEGGHLELVEPPACVGGKNDILAARRVSNGSVFVLRRTAHVPYYAVKYFWEVYTAMEVRV